jgi:hypothetical protein
MKPSIRIEAVVLASALLATSAAAQGDTGFLRGQGHFTAAYSYTNDSYDQFWLGNDLVSPPQVGKVERETASLYVAYGLTDAIDLVVNANYVEAETSGTDPIEDQDDLQDLYLGAKWRVWSHGDLESAFLVLLAPSIKLPMTDYEDNDVTAIGDDQVDLRMRLIAHYRYQGYFWSIESGYDRRNGPPHDEIPVNLTLGGTFGNVTVMPFYSTFESLGGIDIGEGTFPATEEEASRVGLAAYARIGTNFGVTGMVRTTLDGMNTGDANAFSLGLVFNY